MGATLLVNDRVDVALAVGADGAQLREDSIDVARARAILGADALIGVSRHVGSPGSEESADFVVFGAVYRTGSHAGGVPAGVEGLSGASGVRRRPSEKALPLIAIGGITPDRVAEVIAAGAYGVAALSGIWDGGRQAVAAYVAELGSNTVADA